MSRSKRAARARKIAAAQERRHKAARTRMIWTFGGAIGLVAVAVLIAIATLSGAEPDVGDTSAERWDLPALDPDEGRVALSDFAGRPTVAVFFASWCDVCEREIPGFVALSEQLGDQVAWVGINSLDNGRGGTDAARWGIDQRWPIARDIGLGDGRGLATGTFGARGMPLTVIYGPGGEVVHVQRGGISAAGVLSILGQAFGVA